jgi:formylglycine-generating enzyme required for sulfatase activity
MRNAVVSVVAAVALGSSCTVSNRAESRPPDPAAALSSDREQFVSAAGLAMAVIRGPVEFRMGSPATEVGRNPAPDSPDEAQHTARIPRSYAISIHEVTVAQFRRFLDAPPGGETPPWVLG